jgi:TPP-dependent pyruvate/acetoin dehydrogenase alpha subunit
MQIPSSTSYFGSTATKTTSNAGAANAASSTTSPAMGKLKSKGNDVVQEFMDYAKMDPMARMRANILKSMGLTENDVKNMSPEQQKAVEQKIEQLIKEQLQKNAGKTGQVVDVSA